MRTKLNVLYREHHLRGKEEKYTETVSPTSLFFPHGHLFGGIKVAATSRNTSCSSHHC